MFIELETFIAVYETRQFSKAANLLFVSQPSISMRIKNLESQLGFPLFVRQAKSDVIPTPIADSLYPKALDILKAWRDTQNSLKLESNHKLSLKLLASHTTSKVYLPKIVEFLNKHEELSIEVEIANSKDIILNIANNGADLGLIESPITHPSVHRTIIKQDELVLAGEQSEDLWLIRESGSGVRYFTESYFEQYKIKPERYLTLASNSLIISLLKQGIGKSIISKSLIEDIPYTELAKNFTRDFYAITSKSKDYSSKAHVLSELINTLQNMDSNN